MSDNTYLDALRASPLATGADPTAPANPYLDALRDGTATRKSKTDATIMQAVPVAPDKYAEQKRQAKTLGFPVIAVESMPDQSAQDARVKQVQTDIAEHPVLQQRFTDADFAKLAHDDTGVLSILSNSMKRGWAGLKELVPGAQFRANANVLTGIDAVETKLANGQPVLDSEDPYALRFMSPLQRAQFREQAATGAGKAAVGVAALEAEKRTFPQPEVAGRVAAAKTFGGAVDAFLTDPVKYIASIGPESMVQNAPGLVVGGAAGLAGKVAVGAGAMGANSFMTDYNGTLLEALSKAGVDITNAEQLAAAAKDSKLMQKVAAQAFAHAVIVSAVDTASAGAASKLALPGKVLGAKPLTREAANMAVQTPVQGALGGAGELGGQIATGQEIEPGAILAEIVGEGFGAPAEVASMAAGQVRQRVQQAQAENAAKVLQEQMAQAAESKLRERSPETFAAMMQEMADNSPDAPKEVRFDGRQLLELLAQANLPEAELEQMLPSVRGQLQEAVDTGGEVVVPVGEMTALAGTPLEQVLLPHARIGDNEFSQDEAAKATEQADTLTKEQTQRVVDQAGEQAAGSVAAETVKTTVLDQLNAAKRFTPHVNEAYATLVRDFYATMAGRLGVSADELYAQYPLTVQAEGVGPLDQGVEDPRLVEAKRLTAGIRARSKAERDAGAEQISDATLAANRADSDRAIALMAEIEAEKAATKQAAQTRAYRALGDKVEGITAAQREYLNTLENNDRTVELRAAREDVNQAGSATFNSHEVAPGVHDVNVADFEELGGYDTADEKKRIETLAAAIQESGEVEPVFVAVERDGTPWLLEGQHRVRALISLGYKTVPARLVLDTEVGANETLDQAAYHGTPHTVDRFTTQKMGTGEGAQAYGWGMYFAGNKDIAEFYRKKLAPAGIVYDGALVKVTDNRHTIARDALSLGFDATVSKYEALVAKWTDRAQELNGKGPFAQLAKSAQENLAWLKSLDPAKLKQESDRGNTYKVEIPEDSDMLDYDAKLKDQPEKVKAALEKVGIRLVDFNVVSPSGEVLTSQESRDQARTYITRNNVAGKIVEAPTDMDGKRAYNLLSKKLGGDEAASKALLAAGIPGLRFLDAGSRGTFANGESHNYVIFDDSFVGTPELAQGTGKPRGTFNPESLNITLLEKADLSTFLHETGHFFLTAMADIAAQPGAPEAVVKDMNALLDWFGVKDLGTWNSMSLDQQRKNHEKFAESFEQYLFEGKAPSADLQPLFQRFRSWLTNVYHSLSAFLARAGNNAGLTDEVRQVFDRMLASEQQIKQVEAMQAYAPVFKSAEEAGMTPAQWAAYQAQGQQATADAIDKLQTRSVRDMRWASNARSKALKALQKDVAEKRKAVEKEVAAELAKEPVYQAQRWLRKGEMTTPEGDEIKAEKGFRLNTEALTEMYPESALGNPDLEKLKGMTAGNGLHPDVVAEMFGYTSGDQLVRAIADAEPLASAIEGTTDQRLLERFGDLVTERGVQRAADEAVHNEARGRFIATGLRALTDAQAKTEKTPRGGSVNVMLRAAKQFAANLIAQRKVRDLRPGQHVNAEARAGRAVQEAMRKNDTQAAIVAQRDQLLNHYAARETNTALGEVDKALTYLSKFDKPAVRKKLPPEYLDQIDKLLERVDLRRATTQRQLDKRAKLNDWIKSQQDLGIDVELPAAVLEDAALTSYKDMPLETFRGLVESIKQIEHLGRLKDKLLTAKDEREFSAIKDGIVKSILDNAGNRTANTRTPTTNLGRALQGVKQFGAAHIKAATWARILDGGKDGGPVWEHFVRPANERGDMETTMRAKATKDLTAIMAPLLKESKFGGTGKFFPTINRSLNRESILTIALNTGNEGNLQRLLGGEGWNMTQLKPVLDTLSAQDWEAVQKVWNYFDSFRPLIAAKERRVFGKEPDWVEPGSATTDLYKLKGGYYPIKYDPAASVRAEEHADAEGARRQLQGAYGAATTKRSFTKSRTEEVIGRPLLYTLSGVYSGVNDVIHDLAWHEWLIDTNRLLKSQSIDAAIRNKYGPEVVRQFKSWRDDIAEGEQGMNGALDMALGRLRQSVSVAGLGFNVMSALMQPLGITQSITRVGATWIGKGVAQFVAHPKALTTEVNSKSEFMANRSRTRFRELNELRNKVQGQSTTKRVIQENAYFLMMKCQQMVDVPTWQGAYEKAIADGQTEDRAVDLADQAVIDSQGGGQTKDLSAIERGGQAQKLFTVFYSFMNTALNLGVASKMTPKSKAKFVVDMLMLYTVPAVLGSALKNALTPGDEGDDDETIAKKLVAEQISFLMGLMVLTREFAAVSNLLAGKPADYKGPAGVRAIGDAVQFTKQAGQGEFDDAFRKATINLAGDIFGLPSAQLNRSITGAQALIEGETQNPAALALGYQKPK